MNIVNWLNNVNERRKGKEREGERGKVWREERYGERKGMERGDTEEEEEECCRKEVEEEKDEPRKEKEGEQKEEEEKKGKRKR